MSAEKYLRPEVIQQVARLDLKAKFIVEGFLAGLHASPFHGFSVEFSEHRKYVPGDDIKDLDWNVYAKTDKYYIKKFQAETNLTGYLVMDLSASMDYASRKTLLTKFEYCICLAAALAYLMIHQQDPVGLITFGTKINNSLQPKSTRTQLGTILSVLANLKPTGDTQVPMALNQLASMIKHRSMIMVFSDLLNDNEEEVIQALYRFRHSGHEVILFHVLDEAEAYLNFDGVYEFQDPESLEKLPPIDVEGMREDYLEELKKFQLFYKEECSRARMDYVAVNNSISFDKVLMEYLIQRQRRF